MTVSISRIAVPLAAVGLLVAPASARAVDPPPTGTDTDTDTDTDADTENVARTGPWIKRVVPRANMFEVGLFGGIWAPADDLELHFRNAPFQQYEPRSGELGARVGYYPLRHFGFEGELAMMPTRTVGEQRAFVYSARAHAVVQLGLYRIVPFAVIGGGVLAVNSEDNAVGDDADQALTVGGGVKYLVTDHIQLRLDVRDVMSPKRGRTVNDPADSLEVLLGFSVLLGPRKKPAPVVIPPDTDGDGILDDKDVCPKEIGIAPDGCPVRDGDEDGFSDAEDACPEQAGVAPDGCPIPDTDGDGFLDPDDTCPSEAGVAPDGCPIRDIDNDGILAPDDQCPEEPETANGFEDTDGCPDEIPEEIKKFTGVIEGIVFATGKATIRPTSKPLLDSAVKVLADYPALRVEISGHTDNVGADEKNLQLSADRAAAVKQYLVDAGIDTDRILTRGAGEQEPIADNKTKAGRGENRRIEFKLLLPGEATTPTTSEPIDAPTPATGATAPDADANPDPADDPEDDPADDADADAEL